jgi:hypothetical protein
VCWTAKDQLEFQKMVDDCFLKPLHDHQESVIKTPRYQCDGCGEFIPGPELDELEWEDKLLLFCQAVKCQKRMEALR